MTLRDAVSSPTKNVAYVAVDACENCQVAMQITGSKFLRLEIDTRAALSFLSNTLAETGVVLFAR